jgi:hypothetical protein
MDDPKRIKTYAKHANCTEIIRRDVRNQKMGGENYPCPYVKPQLFPEDQDEMGNFWKPVLTNAKILRSGNFEDSIAGASREIQL